MKRYHPKNQYRIINTETGEVVAESVWATPLQVHEREIYIRETKQPLLYQMKAKTSIDSVKRQYDKSFHFWY